MEEIWKDVIGYEGLYQVSSLGRVKSLNYINTGKERLLKVLSINEYLYINLSKLSLMKRRPLHQLVAESFIDKDYKSKGLVVNHKNFKRDDNRLENLELVTVRENNNQKHLPSSSKYTGVYLDRKSNKFASSIKINKVQMYLGIFEDEKEASEYYEAAVVCVNEGRIEDIKIKKRKRSSKYKGVGFYKKYNNWVARTTYKDKSKHIGYFNTEEEAHKAYLDYVEQQKKQD
jgi:hypothetical protein